MSTKPENKQAKRPKLKEVPCLFLDLDGTLRFGPEEMGGKFVNSAEDVHIFPGVIELLSEYKKRGYRLFIVSNQGGIESRQVKREKVIEAFNKTREYLSVDGMCLIDKLYYCPHFLRKGKLHCFCRKPSIGTLVGASAFLRRAHNELVDFERSLVVGDRDEDWQMAINANLGYMAAGEWRIGEHLKELDEAKTNRADQREESRRAQEAGEAAEP